METQTVWVAERIAQAAGLVQLDKLRAGRGYKVKVEATDTALDKVKHIEVNQRNLSQHRTAVVRLSAALNIEAAGEGEVAA